MRAMNDTKGLLGGEFMLWFFRFFMILFISMVIVYSVSYFYSIQYDARQFETKALAKKIAGCIIHEGILDEQAFKELQSCASLNAAEYYVNVTIMGEQGAESSFLGKSDFEVLCAVKGKMQYRPLCLEQKYYVLLNESGELKGSYLDMLIAIGKTEKNA